MPALPDLFTTLHLALLGGFVAVTAALLGATLVNRFRIRHIVLSWRTGRLAGFPVAPGLFLGTVLACFAWNLASGQATHPLLYPGYLLGGSFWFVAVWMTHTVFVTECGLIARAERASVAVSWGQITDYFHTVHGGRWEYVFIYTDPEAGRRRIDLRVPAARQELFEELLSEKLDTRFDLSLRAVADKKALEE